MKRLGLAVPAAVVLWLAVAAPALAEYPPTPTKEVKHAGGVSAFTGANISLGIAVLAVLVIVGVTALLASRRKASSTR